MEKNIEKKVKYLWDLVSAKEKNAYFTDYYNTIGLGNTGDYMYYSELVQADFFKEELLKIVDCLDIQHEELRFYDLLHTSDGERWTNFHQKLDFLASMLNAAGILEYEEQPIYCLSKEKKNPKVKILSK